MIKPAIEFLDKIKGKILIIFGHDCDSISSAVIMFRLLKKMNDEPVLFVAEFNWDLSDEDLKKIKKIKPDGMIIVDIGDISVGKMKKLKKISPVLLVDHHIPKDYKLRYYVNPRLKKPQSYIPASYLCWKIYMRYFDSKEVEWIAGIGTLADHGVEGNEDLFRKIRKDYPKLIRGRLTSRCLFHRSLLGQLVELIDSSRVVKGSTGAMLAVKVLIKSRSYTDVLKNKQLNRWHKLEKKEFDKLIKDMKKNSRVFDGFVLYIFSSKFNLKSSLAGYSPEIFPNKVILIAQKFGSFYEVSLRRSRKCNLSELVKQISNVIPDVNGGGHPSAAAFRIPTNKLDELIDLLKNKKGKKRLFC